MSQKSIPIFVKLSKNPHYPLQKLNEIIVDGYDILIDSNEKSLVRTELINFCNESGLKTIVLPLPTGDYFINRGRGLLIEMKSIADLVSTFTGKKEKEMGKNRLDAQLEKMTNKDIVDLSIRRMFVIRNGMLMMFDHKRNIQTNDVQPIIKQWEEPGESKKALNFHPHSYQGIYEKIQNFGITLILLGGTVDTIQWFERKMKNEIEHENNSKDLELLPYRSMRNVSPNMSDYAKLQALLQGFPLIGSGNAEKILTYYQSFHDFVNRATIEELVSIGLTNPASTEIIRLLHLAFQKIAK